jgi:DNA-binding XRE family transcriptional regulator
VAKNTIASLLCSVGAASLRYQDETLHDLPCRKLQCDEIWSFVGCKQKNAKPGDDRGWRGDVWTWTALCADTYRLERGLTQEQLAAKAKMHRNYVGGVERGEKSPTLKSVGRILAVLGVTWTELGAALDRQHP